MDTNAVSPPPPPHPSPPPPSSSSPRPIDALSDAQLAPDPGSTNPFLPGASRTEEQRDYTAFIEVGPRPAQPAPNTLYTGDSRGGTFLYRVYVPDRGRDAKGGVPLPKVTLEPAVGAAGRPAWMRAVSSRLPTPSRRAT